MAKKEKNSGLGRGLDSLIPNIEEQEVEEGVSLEDLLRESEDEVKTFEELVEEVEEEFEGEDEIQAIEKSADEKDEEVKESSNYTNVFNNDDEIIEEKIIEKESVENIDSVVNLNEESSSSAQINEASDDIKEVDSLLSEKEEKLIDEVIETVENNPRITLWSARSAAVLRYLRKTEPEFSISNEASNLIDAAIAEKYPEIWTLFNHL